jgi:hypothetical protein
VKEPYFSLDWDAIEACPDLQRVDRVIHPLPDEALMRALEDRIMGRPDAVSVRAKWNLLLSGRIRTPTGDTRRAAGPIRTGRRARK